jgi:hypothetical protein
MHTILAYVARAKAKLENATRGLKSQLAANRSDVLVGDCDLCSTFKPERSLGSLRRETRSGAEYYISVLKLLKSGQCCPSCLMFT